MTTVQCRHCGHTKKVSSITWFLCSDQGFTLMFGIIWGLVGVISCMAGDPLTYTAFTMAGAGLVAYLDYWLENNR